ncbi:MAG TPA: glutamate racemase [Vicinamibacterales bacterium]|nr:glutamate racemase [Vicinamibacterales bacterium]
MDLAPTAPIGAFDSGVGGLSVLREIRRELPHESVVYIADSGSAPYGDRPAAFIQDRSIAITRALVERGVKAVVVACNTATGAAVDVLRERFSLPIVAIEPAVKPAAAATRSGVVGVMATSVTISSTKLLRLVGQYPAPGGTEMQACPGLAEQVERGDLESPATRALVQQFVRPLVEKGADTIVLGCTHYAFLTPVIQDVAGPGVTVIDPAPAVARELRRRLTVASQLAPDDAVASERYFTTGDVEQATRVMSQLLGRDITVGHI